MAVASPPSGPPPVGPGAIDWAARIHTLKGEQECGDSYVLAPFPQGVLAAVIDGLGHGSEAATAARIAAETLRERAHHPVADLIKHCHAALYKTRGAVISLASIDTANDRMAWLGVGNVEGVLIRAGTNVQPGRETLLLRSGVCGYQMQPLRTTTLSIFPGDTLILVTDGIDSGFIQAVSPLASPDTIAADILSRYVKETDDALVLVIRYLGTKA